jgi:3-deoxy-7-phosphoheptulonate synthase
VVGEGVNNEALSGLEVFPGVSELIPINKPYKLASRDFKPQDTEVKVGDNIIGGGRFAVIAGPCAVETWEQLIETAKSVKKSGADILRGGAFKPRTNPYSFQGLGEDGLKLLVRAREETGMPFCTEVISTTDVELVSEFADVLQIGARNMQNFALLSAVGKTRKPVLLKRGMMATIQELLLSAEYILSEGNPNVILCERGIRTFSDHTRNTLDLAAVPVLKSLTHLPVLADPSHGVGKRPLIRPMSRGIVAVGADGMIIEVHCNPKQALCDGDQSLDLNEFSDVMGDVGSLLDVLNRPQPLRLAV